MDRRREIDGGCVGVLDGGDMMGEFFFLVRDGRIAWV